MTPEEHQQHHVRLHRALDELLACYVSENVSYPHRNVSINDPILDLLQWAYAKTMVPTRSPADMHQARGHADFEAERQMICLALAELALSRPGFENAIRAIARNFDIEGLPTFEALKAANADRVRAERMPL